MWPKASTEAGLMIEKVKSGDIAAFEELYNFYERSVYLLCLRLTKNISDAEDLTQEVFLQVYRKVNTFRGEAAFGSWLYRVAINAAMMYLRKRKHVEELPLDVLSEDVCQKWFLRQVGFNAHSDPLDRIALVRALSSLSKGRRNMVILHDIKGMTHDEVAELLGVTANTSKSTLSRAHRKLRDVLIGTDHHFYEQTTCTVSAIQFPPPYKAKVPVVDSQFGVDS
jgi:RNA polymerase sigma-70 factor (ECF subfamily)